MESTVSAIEALTLRLLQMLSTTVTDSHKTQTKPACHQTDDIDANVCRNNFCTTVNSLTLINDEDLINGYSNQIPKIVTIKSMKFHSNDTNFGLLEGFKIHQIRKVTGIACAIAEIYRLLLENRHITLRDFFYQNVRTFPNQLLADDAVADVTRLLQTSRFRLNIINCSRGLIRGYVRILEATKRVNDIGTTWIDCMNVLEPRGHSISPFAYSIQDIVPTRTLQYVLVVEKETIFSRLLSEDILDRVHCVMVTAHGYPDLPTRFLLKKMYNTLGKGIPFYVMTDGDPIGLQIALTYAFGAESSKWFTSEDLTMPLMKPVMPCRQEAIKYYGLYQRECVPLLQNDVKRIERIQERLNRLESYHGAETMRQWKYLAESMKRDGMKFELDGVAQLVDLVCNVAQKAKGIDCLIA